MPSPEVIQKAIKAIKRAADYEYFFERLVSPVWIEPLFEAGMFSAPVGPIPEGQFLRFPFWPQSRYLARMSAQASETVLKVILAIPHTENVRIHEDLVDAALAMPPKLASKIVPNSIRWLESRYQLLLPEKLGELVGHLARGGEVEAALKLARALLQPVADPEEATITVGGETHRLSREPRARFDPYYYEEILKKRVPDLVATGGEEAVKLFANLLDEALRLSRRQEEGETLEDFSYIWRPAVEDHEQNHPYTIRHFLVSAVRDSAERVAKNDPAAILRLVEWLESREWPIFRRIALHLLRLFPEGAPKLVSARLTDETRFDDLTTRHEYALLLRERFTHLGERDQETILGWIATGPDLEQFKASTEQWSGKRPTDAEAEQYAKRWKLERLAPIRHALPSEWKQRYYEWVHELGEPDHPEFPSYSFGTWVGPTSPKSPDELRSMSVAEIEEFLRTWQPTGQWGTSSREGLGRALTALVASKPELFAAEGERFRGIDPTHVRALLLGLRDAAGQKRVFPWHPVISLCKWAVDQPRAVVMGRTVSEGEWDEDPNWGWIRKAIGDLLESGFTAGPLEIPFDLRGLAWAVLRPLTEDPDPRPDDEAGMDPATRSINTTRGEAMHAVIQYALWVHRHGEEEAQGERGGPWGFDRMPEVRDVLEEHLDPSKDSSLTIRSVYGRWFPRLLLMDREWAVAQVQKIFPSDEARWKFWAAAWYTYVTFCRPYDEVFEVLRAEYARAVERMGAARPQWHELADPEEKLAEHLMVLYWRGKLSPQEPDALLRRFYSKASMRVRAHALTFIGISLRDTEGDVPPEILERIRELWSWRLEEIRNAKDVATASEELSTFGWWFVSGKFDNVWAVTQLSLALRIAGKVQPDHLIVERLASLAPTLPQKTIECLRLLVEGDKEGWKISGWRDELRSIVGTVISGNDLRAAEAAVDLVHYLGARSYRDLRDLIPKRS